VRSCEADGVRGGLPAPGCSYTFVAVVLALASIVLIFFAVLLAAGYDLADSSDLALLLAYVIPSLVLAAVCPFASIKLGRQGQLPPPPR
jgi:hypothetical protein